MRADIRVSGDKQSVLERLRDAIDRVAEGGREARSALSTGWSGSNPNSLEGWLTYGALHEWFGLISSNVSERQGRKTLAGWTPPLSVLVHLAASAQREREHASTSTCSVVLWIGRRIWPYGHALRHAHRSLFQSSICVDARNPDERYWSIDVALRSVGGNGAVVIADASGLSLALSRRLQLAAESGGALALLARPPWEESELSVAATRWRIRVAPVSADAPRWLVELVRCKGPHAHASHAQSWTVERTDDGRLVSIFPSLADRPHPAALAS